MATAKSSTRRPDNAAEMMISSAIGPFHDALHAKYVVELGHKLDSPTSYEGAISEHLRMSGVYWSLGALSLLRDADEVDESMGLLRGMMGGEGGGRRRRRR